MHRHAVLYDAIGFMKRYSNEGPGCFYVLGTHSPELLNTILFGHITVILNCCLLKDVHRNFFKSFDVSSGQNREVQIISKRTKVNFSWSVSLSMQKESNRVPQKSCQEDSFQLC